MPTYTKRPTKDTVITDFAPTSNGNGAALFTGVDAGSKKWRSLLHFDISDFPTHYSIDSARIEIKNIVAGFLDVEGRLERLTRSDWVESQATWNNYKTGTPWTTPGGDVSAVNSVRDWYEPSATGIVPIGTGGLGAPANMLALVNDAINNRSSQLHVLIRQDDETAVLGTYTYSDREYEDGIGGTYPKLIVGYTVAQTDKSIMDDDRVSTLGESVSRSPAPANPPAPPARAARPG